MDENSLIVDISSDEDVGFVEPSVEYFDWLSRFFEVDEEGSKIDRDDDADDVVIVGEVLAKPKKARKLLNATPSDEDDDCVVLEGDPDKPLHEGQDSGCGADELVIVGEKGQVACRDYPHSRHQCAKFPFNSTPHGSHCDLCHCYVCDSPAPCLFWGTGFSHNDHCHATDKVALWKLQRTKIRHGQSAPAPVVKPSGAYTSTTQPTCNDVLFCPQPSRPNSSVSKGGMLYARVPPPPLLAASSNSSFSGSGALPNQGGELPRAGYVTPAVTAVQAASTPQVVEPFSIPESQINMTALSNGAHSSFGIPSIIRQSSRAQRPNFASARSGLQPNTSQQLLNPCSSSSQREGFSGLHRPFPSRPTFKRPGSTGRYTGPHQSVHSSPDTFNISYHQQFNGYLAAKPVELNPVRLSQSSHLDVLGSLVSEASSMLNQSHISSGAVPSHLQQQYGQFPQPSDSVYDYNQTQDSGVHGFSHRTTLLDNTVQSTQPGVTFPDCEFLPVVEQQPAEFPVVVSPGTMDFRNDSWLMENESVINGEEGSFFPGLEYPSSMPPSMDSGVPYFD